jgi:uncharacterized protein YbjT (DUF2867 family)
MLIVCLVIKDQTECQYHFHAKKTYTSLNKCHFDLFSVLLCHFGIFKFQYSNLIPKKSSINFKEIDKKSTFAIIRKPSEGVKRILIIGGGKQVNHHLISFLISEQCVVRVLSRHTKTLKKIFANQIELLHGDVYDEDQMQKAFQGCSQVFMYLRGKNEETFKSLMNEGVDNILRHAKRSVVQKILFCSDATLEKNIDHYFPDYLQEAEKKIMTSGISYLIVRHSLFMNNIPRCVLGNKANHIGEQKYARHYISLRDFGYLNARYLLNDSFSNKIIYMYGPDSIKMHDALKTYIHLVKPKAKVTDVSITMMKSVAMFSNNQELRFKLDLMEYYEDSPEKGLEGNPGMNDYDLLSFQDWCKEFIKEKNKQ